MSLKHYLSVVNRRLLTHKFCIIFDVETTGFSGTNDRIIQFSAKKYKTILAQDGLKFELVDVFDTLINPLRTLPEFIINLTGITQYQVDAANPENKVFGQIKDFLSGDCFLGAYNSPFDEKMVAALFNRMGWGWKSDYKEALLGEDKPALFVDTFDILPLSRLVFSETKNHNLETVAAAIGANEGLSFHSSLDDVEATMRVFKYILSYDVKDVPKKKLKLISIDPWSPQQKILRIYAKGNLGEELFFDVIRREWNLKSGGVLPYDEDDITAQCLTLRPDLRSFF